MAPVQKGFINELPRKQDVGEPAVMTFLKRQRLNKRMRADQPLAQQGHSECFCAGHGQSELPPRIRPRSGQRLRLRNGADIIKMPA